MKERGCRTRIDALLQIVHAMEIVAQFAEVSTIQADRHRVDREIAAAQIVLDAFQMRR